MTTTKFHVPMLSAYMLMAALLYSGATFADQSDSQNVSQRITLGVKLLGATWKGEDPGSQEFKSDQGGQFGFNIAYAYNRFYTGLNLQSGNYEFKSRAPDKLTTAGRVPTNNQKIKQTDFDLLAGYYFWKYVALFADIKQVRNDWLDDSYYQTFNGLGLGANAYYPLSGKWTLFGSLGFIGKGDLKDQDDKKVGEGKSWALEVGTVYMLNSNNYLNAGIKTRQYKFEANNGSNQDYAINAFFIGYTYNIGL